MSDNQLEEEATLKENSSKLLILYYYLGLIVGVFIVICSAYFSDQKSDSYQNIFCNTYKSSSGGSPDGGSGVSYGDGSSGGSSGEESSSSY